MIARQQKQRDEAVAGSGRDTRWLWSGAAAGACDVHVGAQRSGEENSGKKIGWCAHAVSFSAKQAQTAVIVGGV